MSETSPYSSPQSPSQPPFPPQQIRSSVPKVIGILHIIYAVFGIFIGVSAFISSSLMKTMQTGSAADDAAMGEIMSAMDNLLKYSYMDGAVKILLGVLLLFSGIKLLNYQAAGLKFSNIWTIVRLVWFVIITAISYSATQAFQQKIMQANPEAAAMMKSLGIFGIVIGFLFIAAYPIISYILLNRASVKKDLN